tara:strand:- start:67 stop:375 length:309 start_codon:yes stop_codon:yes gene_type:complete
MKIYYVDIDETICTCTDGQYQLAKPLNKNIKKINKLYDEGNTIIYWTARGTVTQIDWLDTTKKQLKDWGAKCHDVRVGKPHYDYFICDKAINSRIFFSKEEN